MGLPSTNQPQNPGLNFATINAETLDEASREMEFKVPEDKVIDNVCALQSLSLTSKMNEQNLL